MEIGVVTPSRRHAQPFFSGASEKDREQSVSLRPHFENRKSQTYMIIVDVKDGESIERALKKFKRKTDKAGVLREVRRRKHYVKPSVARRNEFLKAVYREKKRLQAN